MTVSISAAAASSATTPEEAALVFKQAVATGLAKVMADALGKALGTQAFSANPATAGWQDFCGGIHVDLGWAKPASEFRALTLATAYSPVLIAAASGESVAATALGVEVGISIRASF